jgi:uncharacterized protein (DUF1330 family)
MPAYVVVEIEVRDAQQYERYKQLAAASVGAHGGRYIARGGATETLEGSWSPSRLVMLEFPTMQHARDWYGSADYREAMAVRQGCASAQMVLTEGYEAPGGGPTVQL